MYKRNGIRKYSPRIGGLEDMVVTVERKRACLVNLADEMNGILIRFIC